MIWMYALGGYQINIHGPRRGTKFPDKEHVRIGPVSSEVLASQSFIKPTFCLPQVCRQIYVEASQMIYTLNTFGFNNGDTMDRWYKSLPLGCKRAVTSIDVPLSYMKPYRNGYRKSFLEKFSNIKRIGIDAVHPFYIKSQDETYEQAKERTEKLIREWDCKQVRIDWHTGSSGSRGP